MSVIAQRAAAAQSRPPPSRMFMRLVLGSHRPSTHGSFSSGGHQPEAHCMVGSHACPVPEMCAGQLLLACVLHAPCCGSPAPVAALVVAMMLLVEMAAIDWQHSIWHRAAIVLLHKHGQSSCHGTTHTSSTNVSGEAHGACIPGACCMCGCHSCPTDGASCTECCVMYLHLD